MRICTHFSLAVLCVALLAGCTVSRDKDGNLSRINGSISANAGQTYRALETVNGSITIADNVAAESAETVNGRINLGSNARVGSLETVNGDIHIRTGAQIAHTVTSVNGDLELASGSHVGGKLSNINGKIVLDHAVVDGMVETTSGDITIGDGSVVHGGLHVDKPGATNFNLSNRKPRIVIGPNAVVDGALVFDREVDLLVSSSAKIGAVTGATAKPIDGSAP